MTEQQQTDPQAGAQSEPQSGPQDGPQSQQPPYAQQQPPPYAQYQYPAGGYPPPPYKRLTRTSWDSPISGVCGGIARYFGVDPTLIRVLAVIGAVVTFPVGLIAYVVAWAIMPKE